jgi:pimeloyl-ACP methyl ester carboxylesterase
MKGRVTRWIRASITILAVILLVAGVVGWSYEQIGRRVDRQLYPQVGRSIDIGGRTLNIYCSGQGSPAVVFEAGGAGNGYSWTLTQFKVAQFTQACWYDRAGAGWSDPPARPRTSTSATNDLHELLRRAGVSPPYVLVGASVGGEYARVYTAKFPSDVAGLVLVDSSHPDQNEPPAMKSAFNLMSPFRRQALCTALPVMSRFGILRFMLRPRPGFEQPKLVPENVDAVNHALSNRPLTSAIGAEQVCAATENGKVVPKGGTGNPELDDAARSAGGLGERPLIVLTAGQPFVPADPIGRRQAMEFHDVWVHQLQAQLATLSTRGRQIVLANSGHSTMAPEEIVKAVEKVVQEAQMPSSADAKK